MADEPDQDHALLVGWDQATRAARQSADVLLHTTSDPVAGWSWIRRALDEHPGCQVCGVHDERGDWLLVGLQPRDGGQRGIERPTAERILRIAYLLDVTRRRAA